VNALDIVDRVIISGHLVMTFLEVEHMLFDCFEQQHLVILNIGTVGALLNLILHSLGAVFPKEWVYLDHLVILVSGVAIAKLLSIILEFQFVLPILMCPFLFVLVITDLQLQLLIVETYPFKILQ
jgi:hypothetical protein